MKRRVDVMPMDRAAQADGGAALLDLREVDHDHPLARRRRTGTKRTLRRAYALGAKAHGARSRLFDRDAIDISGGFAMGASINAQSVLAVGEYPLMTLRAGATISDSYQVFLERESDGTYSIGIRSTNDAGTGQKSTLIAIANDDRLHFVARLNAGGTVFDIEVQGDSTGSESVVPSGSFGSTMYLELIGDPFGSDKPTSRAPIIDNPFVYEGYEASTTDMFGERTLPATPERHYNLSEGGQAFANQGSDSGAVLFAYPAAPEIVGSYIELSGKSGALIVKHNQAMEEFWSTRLREVAQQHFTFYVKGVRRGTGEGVLLDYGGLGKLEVDSSNNLKFTHNGVSVTEATNAIADGTSVSVRCGRANDTIFLRVVAGSDATQEDTSDPPSPFLDFQHVRDLYVGAEEDPSLDTRCAFSLSEFGFYPFESREEGNEEGALVFVRASSGKIEDLGLRSANAYAAAHSDRSGPVTFAPCAIQDAEHLHIEGGVVVSESMAPGYDGGIGKKLTTDVVGERIGDRIFFASNGEGSYVDLDRGRMSPLEVPLPGTPVSAAAVSPGVLEGAYAHGYRVRRADGSYGPIYRMNPASYQGARAILGSSTAADEDDSSELGETYGVTGREGTNPDAFAGISSTLTDEGNYPLEDHFWLPDWKSSRFEEKIYHRGGRSVKHATAGARAHFKSDQSAMSIDVTGNFLFQTSFRYQQPEVNGSKGWRAMPCFAVGQVDRATANGTAIVNPDFFAFISEGHTDAADYGTTSNPRMVFALSRQKWQITYQGGPVEYDNLSTNFYMLTFSNDGSTWVAGHDYNVLFARSGAELLIYVHDITADTWTTLTGNTMTGYDTAHATYQGGSADTKADYDSTDIFQGWRPKSNTRTILWGASTRIAATIPFLTAGGDVNHTAGESVYGSWDAAHSTIHNAPADLVHYHYRAWERNYSFSVIKQHSEKRFAAFPGEALDNQIFVDFAPIFEDPTKKSDRLYDANFGGEWLARDKRDPVNIEHFEQDAANQLAKQHPIHLLATPGDSFDDAAVKVFFTAQGDGSLIIQAGDEGSYSIRTRFWNQSAADAKYAKTVEEVRNLGVTLNDWNAANWIAYDIEPVDAGGSARYIRILHLAINGVVLFDDAIGGDANEINNWSTTTPTYGWIHLGGYADGSAIPTEEVRRGEFRLWDDGYGPQLDDGSDFDYLAGRVSENEYSGGTNKLIFYAKFQPGDVNGANLTNYGSASAMKLEGDALVEDGREIQPSIDDPVPAVAFPENPTDDAVALQLFRTQAAVINNFDDDTEIQEALDVARGLPLSFLAEVPIGSSHYVDNAQDSALGYDGDERDGYVPGSVKQIFSWRNHVCLLSDDGIVHVQTPGPSGWASYPIHMRYEAELDGEADKATAAAEVNGSLVLAGSTSFAIIGGGPTSPRKVSAGRSAGAYGPKCIASDGAAAYIFNGTLWQIVPGQQPRNIGGAVQDLLPDPANARLAMSSSLSGLLVIDEATGLAMRLSFKTGRWSIEGRDARSIGDTSSGYALVTRHGAHADDDATKYADDVGDSTPTSVAGTKATNRITMSTTGLSVGMRCTIREDANTQIEARISAVTGSYADFDDLTGIADGAVTVYPGAPKEGFLIDTGMMNAQRENGFLDRLTAEVLLGSGWEYAYDGHYVPDERDSQANLSWDDFGDGITAIECRGQFLRVLARHVEPTSASMNLLEVTIRP